MAVDICVRQSPIVECLESKFGSKRIELGCVSSVNQTCNVGVVQSVLCLFINSAYCLPAILPLLLRRVRLDFSPHALFTA